MRTTETCLLLNQQIFTMRSLHYQLRAVIDLSLLKVKKPLVDGCVDVSSQRYSTPDIIFVDVN